MKKYIVTHNRDRDQYQVSEALSEVSALETLITDYYYERNPVLDFVTNHKLRHRLSKNINREHVTPVTAAFALQAAFAGARNKHFDYFKVVDSLLARKTLDVAISRPDAGLFIYSNYAYEAFRSPHCIEQDKNLFLFHPHPNLIEQILKEDFDLTGIGRESLLEEAYDSERRYNLDIELFHADKIICASKLSKKSVDSTGISKAEIKVVPYGVVEERVKFTNSRKENKKTRFLFVGQAIQRKGLHHLLSAWQKTSMKSAELVLVCSREQDSILRNIPDSVEIKKNLSMSELENEYNRADCFVLPSLVEGFGLVLLEALQAGCYIVYSDATGLADTEVPVGVGKQVEAGNVSQLSLALEDVTQRWHNKELNPDAIRMFSSSLSSQKFRSDIRTALGIASQSPV
jgi:glycosyltransferase involved in cell wall biosynthesis